MSDMRGPFGDMHNEFRPKQLDVLAAIREAYSGAWNNLGEMLRLIWLPVVLYLILNIIGAMLPDTTSLILRLAMELANFALWAVISVAWYRFILIGDATGHDNRINFGRRETRYLFVTFALILLAMPVFMFAGPPELPISGAVSSFLAGAGSAGALISFFGILLSIVGLYFLVRLSLLLPAVSIDEPINIRLVLERTRGNFWRIFALFILSSLPLIVAYILLLSLFLSAGVPVVIALGVTSLLSIFIAIVNVAVLAIAYRELIGPPGAMAADLDRQDTV
mgnify:CR=1 FL=1|tara:strand:- start:2473 stop:3309 length:837 start_codon:yes stop_codon:yes gene_type:complete